MSGTSITTIANTIGYQAYKLAFEISPIVLQNGIAAFMPVQLLPIVAITESGAALNILSAFVGGNVPENLDDFFAHFYPSPGASLIDFEVAKYPFANLTVAANAIIAQPLRVGMTMRVPVRTAGGYVSKFTTFLALRGALNQHALLGGTYNVLTPTYLYTNCILTTLTEAGAGDSKQWQSAWQFEFEQPLITQSAADQAQSSLMQQITNATPIDGQPATSGGVNVLGAAAIPGVAVGASNLTGTSVAPYASTGLPVVPVSSAPL